MKKHAFSTLVNGIKQAGKIRRDEMTGGRIIASHPSGFRSISITDLRRKTSRVLDAIKDSMEPLFITRHGKVVAVLQSIKAYMKMESERRRLLLIVHGKQGGSKRGTNSNYDINELVAGITEENLHKEVLWRDKK